jgi:hypothetical protein
MFIYYVNRKKYTTDDEEDIPWHKVSSPNENKPAVEYILTGYKVWCKKRYFRHRLTGPAIIWPDGYLEYWLNWKKYKNIHDWLKDHPNQTNTFQVEMLLKYT